MTRTTNARIAGASFLAYIAAGVADMSLHAKATAGSDIAGKLASISLHGDMIRYGVLLGMLQTFCALVLGVTLYGITRDEDHELAVLGMICRVAEGIVGAFSVPATLALFWLATATGGDAPDRTAAHALAAYLMRNDVPFTATFFAAGSTLFAWLLLRGRMIPSVLAWVGLLASALLLICLPLQLSGFLRGPFTQWMWLPMILFEVPLALWFLVKGVAAPARVRATQM